MGDEVRNGALRRLVRDSLRKPRVAADEVRSGALRRKCQEAEEEVTTTTRPRPRGAGGCTYYMSPDKSTITAKEAVMGVLPGPSRTQTESETGQPACSQGPALLRKRGCENTLLNRA